MDALERLKLRLSITDDKQDALLSELLDEAQNVVLDIIGRDSLPARLLSVQVELALAAYNKQGAEGESSRTEGGISRSFVDGLPADMKQRLQNYPRKVGVIYASDGTR